MTDDEMAALAKALKAFETKRPASVAVIRTLMLTGLRVSEVLGMKWQHVNFGNGADGADGGRGRLLLPKTKTGRRQTDLPEAALTLLSEIPRVCDYCFSSRGKKPTTYKTVWRHFMEVAAIAGIEGVRPHDLRRSVMTRAAASGVDTHVLRDLLGHRSAKIADRYIRSVGEPVRLAREAIGAEMADLLAAGDSEDGDGDGEDG